MNFKMPFTEADELIGKATDFISLGDNIAATLSANIVNEALSPRGRGGRRGRRGGGIKDPKGSVTFSIKDGILTRFTVALSGSIEFQQFSFWVLAKVKASDFVSGAG